MTPEEECAFQAATLKEGERIGREKEARKQTAVNNRAFAKLMEKHFRSDLKAQMVIEFIQLRMDEDAAYEVGLQAMEVM